MAGETDDDVSTDDGPDVEADAPDEAPDAVGDDDTADATDTTDDADATGGGVPAPSKTKTTKRRPDPRADVAARRAATSARMDAEKADGPVSVAKATADDPTGTKARRAKAKTGATGTATAADPTGAKARRQAAATSKKVARPSKRTGGATPDPKADRVAARSGNPKKAATATDSGRYTQPIPRSQLESPVWVPAIMFTLLGLGGIVILLTYVVWDGRPLTLGVGLALILGGILTATQYR